MLTRSNKKLVYLFATCIFVSAIVMLCSSCNPFEKKFTESDAKEFMEKNYSNYSYDIEIVPERNKVSISSGNGYFLVTLHTTPEVKFHIFVLDGGGEGQYPYLTDNYTYVAVKNMYDQYFNNGTGKYVHCVGSSSLSFPSNYFEHIYQLSLKNFDDEDIANNTYEDTTLCIHVDRKSDIPKATKELNDFKKFFDEKYSLAPSVYFYSLHSFPRDDGTTFSYARVFKTYYYIKDNITSSYINECYGLFLSREGMTTKFPYTYNELANYIANSGEACISVKYPDGSIKSYKDLLFEETVGTTVTFGTAYHLFKEMGLDVSGPWYDFSVTGVDGKKHRFDTRNNTYVYEENLEILHNGTIRFDEFTDITGAELIRK